MRAGLRDAALISVMSDALLRVSEVVVLTVSDVVMESDGTGRLTVQRSKTDQAGQGAVLFLGAPVVDRVQSWMTDAGICSGYVFRRLWKGGGVSGRPLSPESVRRMIRCRAKAAGLRGRYSGHSLRVGSAQSLVRRGATLPEAQLCGRWGTPRMVAHYARAQRAGQGAVARLRYGHQAS